MIKHKKLTRANGITIPKDLREEIGLDAGMALDVESDPINKQIVIKKHVPVCRFCKTIENVHTIMGDIEICPECATKIAKEVKEKYGID